MKLGILIQQRLWWLQPGWVMPHRVLNPCEVAGITDPGYNREFGRERILQPSTLTFPTARALESMKAARMERRFGRPIDKIKAGRPIGHCAHPNAGASFGP